MIKGNHWYFDMLNIPLNKAGLASLYPVAIRIAARDANGILFNWVAKNNTPSNKISPWMMLDSFDWAPALRLAVDLTMTEVNGKPPIKPEIILPVPCASSSRLVGVTLLSGSILSVASMVSKVSNEATIPKVNATIQTSLLNIPEKSGNDNWLINPEVLSNTGRWTIWASMTTRCAWAVAIKTWLRITPNTTAIKAPGNNFRLAGFILSQANITIRHTIPMIAAPGWILLNMLKMEEKLFSPSAWKKSRSPSVSLSYPTKWGICLRIIMMPIPVSIPLITLEGK